ncbi:chromate transporter [Schleiferilactobacillus harbinensis]|uniref:chromate transporter n=1 Tax=Schleiferilactobacillus harbinensis TaxID=304207 RepID=UPI001AAE3722|nr:chromate transporter [Schleiferilactobacillus harbinensis]
MHKNWILFKVYLLAGTFTFSGGMAMLPVIERELVGKYHLIERDQLYEYATLSQTFPGVIALNNACFVGKKIGGTVGIIAASLGAILPAFVLMLAATIAYQMIPQEGVVLSIMAAIRAASAAFLFSTAYSLARFNLKDAPTIILAAVCFLLTVLNLANAPTLIVIAGIVGIILSRVKQVRRV